MALRAGRVGVKKANINPIDGSFMVEFPEEIDASTVNNVGIRVNPSDSEKIQYKTPDGNWTDFKSGSDGATLLWENLNFAPAWGGTPVNVNTSEYKTIIIVAKGNKNNWTEDVCGVINKNNGVNMNKPYQGNLAYSTGFARTKYTSTFTYTESTITFDAAYSSASDWSTDFCVPYRIYGIK